MLRPGDREVPAGVYRRRPSRRLSRALRPRYRTSRSGWPSLSASAIHGRLTALMTQVDRQINMPFVGTTDIARGDARSVLLDAGRTDPVTTKSGSSGDQIVGRGLPRQPTFPAPTISELLRGKHHRRHARARLAPVCRRKSGRGWQHQVRRVLRSRAVQHGVHGHPGKARTAAASARKARCRRHA